MSDQNNKLVLVMGVPASGKSASLRNLPQQEMVYFNADLKDIPFKHNFLQNIKVSNPADIVDYIEEIESFDGAKGGVVDTLTYLMDMYETQYVLNSSNTQKAWGDYAQFYKRMIHAIKSGTKEYAIMAHSFSQLNEQKGEYETVVPIKGAVGKKGCEGDFTTIVVAKQVPIKKLEGYENDLLTITEDEELDGFKYVFQTRLTKDSLGEKMRAPMGMWSRAETYIDNDLDLVFKRLNEFFE